MAFGVLTILGVIGFVMRVSDGVGDRAVWGYYAAMFSFMVTTASAAPMVAIAPRMANSHWRRPISRAAELWSVVGLLSLLWFIPLLWILPPLSDGRRSLWFFDMGASERRALLYAAYMGLGGHTRAGRNRTRPGVDV